MLPGVGASGSSEESALERCGESSHVAYRRIVAPSSAGARAPLAPRARAVLDASPVVVEGTLPARAAVHARLTGLGSAAAVGPMSNTIGITPRFSPLGARELIDNRPGVTARPSRTHG